jgi:hypothetical protein
MIFGSFHQGKALQYAFYCLAFTSKIQHPTKKRISIFFNFHKAREKMNCKI